MRPLLIFVLLLLAVNTVSAYQQADMGRVKQANFNAPQGYVIFSIYANDIVFSDDWSIQTFNLNAFGQNYVLTVKARAEGWFGTWKHFVINLTYPNGTTVSQDFGTTQLLGVNDYDIKIQYYAEEPDNPFELDVYIILNPLQATLDAAIAPTFRIESYIVFNQVVFSSTDEAHLEIYYTTIEDWQDITKNPYSLERFAENIANAINELKEAAKNIPGAGMVIETFDSLYFIFSGGLYYIKLIFVDNGLLTFALFEAFALAFSAGTSRNFYTFMRKYVNWHRALFEFTIGLVRTFIDIVSKVVQALKPI